MKVAIIETVHFQYGLTQSELFEGNEKIFFVTQEMHSKMHDYNQLLCDGEFVIVPSIYESYKEIISKCNKEGVNLMLISPIFGSYKALLEIVKHVNCEKAITIHNLNFWLKARFRTPKYYRERRLKQEIVKHCDHIIVEDFIYNYVKNHQPELFNKYSFLYLPYTIFHKREGKKYHKEDDTLKIVLTGGIHKERRRYETVVELIQEFAHEKAPIKFSFAGRPIAEYGKWVTQELDKANSIHPGIVDYFPIKGPITPDMFLREMETSDLVLSTSTTEFNALGTTEYIGKTKPTAAIHDMISFQLPGLLPQHLEVPKNLEGSVFNYNGYEDLKAYLQRLIYEPEVLQKWREQAAINSHRFTAAEIRKGLPFFTRKEVPTSIKDA